MNIDYLFLIKLINKYIHLRKYCIVDAVASIIGTREDNATVSECNQNVQEENKSDIKQDIDNSEDLNIKKDLDANNEAVYVKDEHKDNVEDVKLETANEAYDNSSDGTDSKTDSDPVSYIEFISMHFSFLSDDLTWLNVAIEYRKKTNKCVYKCLVGVI